MDEQRPGKQILYNEKDLEVRALYVAMTRAKKNLYFTRPKDYSFPYDKDLAPEYYEVRNKEEKRPRTIDEAFEF